MTRLGVSRPLDPLEFERLRAELDSRLEARRKNRIDPGHAPPVPDEVGLQLTNRCNLRCEQCFQWNDEGHHRRLPVIDRDRDLPFEVVDAVLTATASRPGNLYLWGGEPLIYRHWDRLAQRLREQPRWTVLCTNGIAIEAKLDSLLAMSEHLAALVSLDGLEAENDALRGRGTFRRIVRGVEALLAHQRRGEYRGEISISAVLSEALLPRLSEFVSWCEDLGINTLYLVFPWFITPNTAARMDAVFQDRFEWLAKRPRPHGAASWHSYGFHIRPEYAQPLIDALDALDVINASERRIRVRLQPSLTRDEIEGFLRGDEKPAQGRTHCTATSSRLSVMPDGRITTCKLFPELAYAQLDANPDTVLAAWQGAEATRLRTELGRELLPICGKCVQLYLHGY
jgi:MoaA/NifB/PqqE/SkfB family radical SAM enzyme